MTYLDARSRLNSNPHPAELAGAVVSGDFSLIEPRRSLLLPQGGMDGTPAASPRRSVMRTRRANILAKARQLIAEETYDHVVMRKIAERSGVSIPTIYNLIGGRDEVLLLATQEAMHAQFMFALARAEQERINPVLALVDTFWMCLACDPAYSSQVMRCIINQGNENKTGGHILEEVQARIRIWLEAMRANRNFRYAGVSAQSLAEFITRQIAAAVVFWMENGTKSAELRRNLAQGTGLLLLGALSHEAATGVTRWLKQVEQLTQNGCPSDH